MDIIDIVAGGHVRTVFQPIVDLDSATVVAYEALSRGPAGALERPDVLFAAARQRGCLAELDGLCRSSALRNAILAGVASPQAVFVNIEPEVLDSAPLDELIGIAESAPGGLPVVLEITERAISARPAELLSCVRRLRAAGWRIALDDVGADDMSLAFMPLLRPDIVKLDIKLVQERPGPAVAGIMNAVNAYAQRTGAVLLAEGIEDQQHLDIARALGARLGQGWMFGHPQPTLADSLPVGVLELPAPVLPGSATSPFACLPDDMPLRRSTKPLLIELSKHLEREALRHGSTCVVASTFQYARHFTRQTAERYKQLASTVGFVDAIGEGLDAEPVPGVRGADLAAGDALRGEWDIAVLAPHFSAALLARDLGDDGPDVDRRFEFALTYDRGTVSAAAEALLSRVLPTTSFAGHDRPAHQISPRDLTLGGAPTHRAAAASAATAPQNDVILYRALASTTNGISIADVTRADHPLIYVNAAFEQLSGYRGAEVLGGNCRILQGPQTDPAAVQRIRTAIAHGQEARETLLNYRRGTGEPWWNEIFLSPVVDESGNLVQYIGVQNDVTARVHAENQLCDEQHRSRSYLAEIESLAYLDPLTGLLNRRRLDELLTTVLHQAQTTNTSVAFLFIDVDDFKTVNDTHGHIVGDTILSQIAHRLTASRRPHELIARLGGDEFLIVTPNLRPDEARFHAAQAAAANRLQLRINTPGPPVSVSIGTSTYPHDGNDFDALVHAADQRMYSDKNANCNPTRSTA